MNNLDFAKKLLEIGDREGAKKDLDQITSNNPENIEAWFLLAQTLEDKEKKKDCYRQIIRVDPNNRLAQDNLKHLIEETNHIEESDFPETTTDSKKRSWSTPTRVSLIIGFICVLVISVGLINTFNSKNKIQIASTDQPRTSTNPNREQKSTSIPPKSVLYEKNSKSYLPDEHDLPAGFKFRPDASLSAPETKFPFGDGYKRWFVKENAAKGTPLSAHFVVVVLNSEEVAEMVFSDFAEFIKDDSLGVTWYLDDEELLRKHCFWTVQHV